MASRLIQAAQYGLRATHLLNEDSGHLRIHCRHTSRPQQRSHVHALQTSLCAETPLYHDHMAQPTLKVEVQPKLCTLLAPVTVRGGLSVLKAIVANMMQSGCALCVCMLLSVTGALSVVAHLC